MTPKRIYINTSAAATVAFFCYRYSSAAPAFPAASCKETGHLVGGGSKPTANQTDDDVIKTAKAMSDAVDMQRWLCDDSDGGASDGGSGQERKSGSLSVPVASSTGTADAAEM